MKQKIVIRVSMNCDKCRTKALKIAAVANGVTKVELVGEDKDKLSIEGEGVDAANLTKCLRKKLCHASLEVVEEIKPAAAAPEKEEEEEKHECQILYCPQPPPYQVMAICYDECPSRSSCTIM